MRWLSGTKQEIMSELDKEKYTRKAEDQQVEVAVKEIIDTVLTNGDQALIEYSKEFDRTILTDLEVSPKQIEQAYQQLDADVKQALEKAKENIISYHKKQKQYDFMDSEKNGVFRGQLVRPLERVGVYVPGGTAAYPSSVLMNVLPAKIAGVEEIIMVTPPSPKGVPSIILAAAKIAGVDRVFQIGGAQAVGALAYGTDSVPKVDKIVGPGNIYVATAKKMVFGVVGIDMIAGPSEIGVLADSQANPAFIAADLLSQAEHDVLARTFLVTNSKELAEEVEREIAEQLITLPRKDIAERSIVDHSWIILTDTEADMFAIMNEIAPEHLEVQMADPMSRLHEIKHAGSIFLGAYTSEPVGDYLSGTNHVLPTSGTAKFYSPLGVYDFIKYSQVSYYTKEALAEIQADIALLARKEGLEAHARAVEYRFKEENQ
ncbi:histidinol dehydrogenase [Candidatus Enterococcus clewellii]|uniref:Histidinol dehydrogenase n=1 Tax=Candidatus Enterococcus clewellii TaxID=1834193 RepID=A0A242K2V4_9ENTE|nr:histidinol dehydrogenase [Enterococcus sp. 9E7_DIV0242]OTP12919.1 histidinol dehydrogenase [Enterococcus sp. 9E7_DIV0242]